MSTDIKTVNLTVAIPPRRLGNERHAIEDKLNILVSQYVPEADGVLIKWTDLEILSNNGLIVDDQPYSFWKIQFTAHIFKPDEGKLVRATVHQVLKQYFIVRAMKSFTATVAIPEKFADHDLVKNLTIDQEVYFRIMGSSEGAYRGEMDDECLKMTATIREQEMDAEDNVYDYANDFEY